MSSEENAPPEPPLTLSQRAVWALVIGGVLVAVLGMVLVYWPGMQLSTGAVAP